MSGTSEGLHPLRSWGPPLPAVLGPLSGRVCAESLAPLLPSLAGSCSGKASQASRPARPWRPAHGQPGAGCFCPAALHGPRPPEQMVLEVSSIGTGSGGSVGATFSPSASAGLGPAVLVTVLDGPMSLADRGPHEHGEV